MKLGFSTLKLFFDEIEKASKTNIILKK